MKMINKFRFYIILLFALITVIYGAKTHRQLEKELLDQILRDYDPRIRPDGINMTVPNSPVVVQTNIYVRSITNLDENNMQYDTQLTFRMQWNDPRFVFNDQNGAIKYLTLKDSTKLWTPDIFFSNEIKGHFHMIMMPNVLVRIYPDGGILYSQRISLTLGCPMDFGNYPFDKQTCSIQLASYGYTTDELVLVWKESDPIQITKSLNLKGFTLNKFTTDYCTARTNTGKYTCQKIEFLFKREWSKSIQRWIIPTAIMTLISFISFWIKPKKCSRIVLLIVALIILWHHIDKIQDEIPQISYDTAIDRWTCTCSMFMIAAFIEYAIVYYINNKKNQVQNQDKEKDAVAMKPLVDEEQQNHAEDGDKKEYAVTSGGGHRQNLIQRFKKSSVSSKIDLLSGILFPLAFVIYIVVFFSKNCLRAHYE